MSAFASTWRDGNSASWAPSKFCCSSMCAFVANDSELFNELRKRFFSAKRTHNFCGSAVAHLLNIRCPADVVRLVIPVVITPIKGIVRRRPISNSLDEFHRIVPIFKNSNSSLSIMPKRVIFFVVTAVHHLLPDFVSGVLRHAMRRRALDSHIDLATTAALSVPADKMTRCVDASIAAVALTKPLRSRIIFLVRRALYRHESTKTLTNEVSNFSAHASYLTQKGDKGKAS